MKRPEETFKTLLFKELADVTTHLVSCPASSASVKGVFSSFGIVHIKQRTHVGVNLQPNKFSTIEFYSVTMQMINIS